MGKHGKEILNLDVDDLINKLNEALAEEWLAYYQYWIGSRVIEGPMRIDIEPELQVHADQELNHADMLANRIDQLGGTPVLSPAEWMKLSKCEYMPPEDPYVEKILEQNLDAERCAIKRYQELANMTYGKDHTTYNIVTQILDEEVEHEQEIEDWMGDIDIMKENWKKLRM